MFARFCSRLRLENNEPMMLEPFQRVMLADYFAGARETLILISKKNGKALALDTPIPTPDGWTTQGDLVPGDEVFGEDGRCCRVVAVTAPMVGRPCYRVAFSDQTEIVADGEHEWRTRLINGAEGIRTTGEIAETLLRRGDGARNHSIAVAGALECQPTLLLVDPYVLGAWIGDGTTTAGSVTFGEPFVRHEITRCGYTVASGHERLTATVYGLKPALRELGVLGAKHIPVDYLRAATHDRLALLQGIMDTDGYISEAGQAELVTVKPRLRDDYMDLIRSLGFKPSLKTDRAMLDGRDCGARYRIQFWAFAGEPVFRMPRKLHRQKLAPARRQRSASRQIVAVDRVPSVPVRCIEVDSPSRLYLAGRGMVPTHNSTLLAALALYHLVSTPDAECVIAAASRDQATIIWDQAAGFVRRSPGLELRADPKRGYREIRSRRDNGRIRVLAADADTADGVIPTLALVDEMHRHKSAELYGVFRDGLGPRAGRMVTISTAGDDETGALGVMRHAARNLRDAQTDGKYLCARTPDGAFVLHEWALDASDDRDDLDLVLEVNPASWQTKEALAGRHASPSMTPWAWARFACGVWLAGENSAITPAEWDRLEELGVRIPEGALVYVGLDLGWKIDTTAIVPLHWESEARRVVSDVEILTPPVDGTLLDERLIVDRLLWLQDRFELIGIVYDPNAGGQQMVQQLERGHDLPFIEHSQDNSPIALADGRLMEAIRRRVLIHDGDRDLRQHALNVVERPLGGEKFKFDRPRRGARKPNDALRALSMAHSVAVAAAESPPSRSRVPVFS